MKRKHTYLVSIGVMMLSLLLAGLWFAYGRPNKGLQSTQRRLPPMPTITMPSPQALAEIDRLENRLNRLAALTGDDQAAPDLRLFGYRIRDSFTPATYPVDDFKPAVAEYSLTFAFASEKKRYCIINGTFFSEGDRLPDGGRILKVEASRVLIEKEAFKQWVIIDKSKPAVKEKREIVAKPS